MKNEKKQNMNPVQITDILGLVPRPRKVEFTCGKFTCERTLQVSSPPDFQNEYMVLARQLQDIDSSFTLKKSTAFTKEDDFTASFLMLNKGEPFPAAKPGAYTLRIVQNALIILAADTCGAFYALQTLRQLIMTAAEKAENKEVLSIPCCDISDEPRYEWRGFMLDTARNFFPVTFIKKLLDAMSLHKLNRFHWHLTDDQGWRLPVEKYPKLTEIGATHVDPRFYGGNARTPKRAWYTHEEIRDVVRYATERHITIVPEIETPGHASAFLAAYPELGCTGGPYCVENRFGVFEDVMCAGNDAVFSVLEEVFNTVCELFPGPYIHIGGDECPRDRWNSCPKCRTRITDNNLSGADELQSWITAKIASMVEKRGKIPLGWDEVLEGAEKVPMPRNLTVMSWKGNKEGRQAARLKHPVVMCPSNGGCYLDYPHLDDNIEPGLHQVTTVEQSYLFSPVPHGLSEEDARFVLGGQGNLWTELLRYPRWVEYMIFPRLCALSEALWLSENEKDLKSFSYRLAIHKKRMDLLDIIYYRGKFF